MITRSVIVRRLLLASIWSITLLCVLTLAIVLLLATQTGTSWLLQGAARVAPGTVNVEDVRGTLLAGVSLSGVDYERLGLSARIEHVELRWRPERLLDGEINVQTLSIDGLDLTLPQTDKQSDAPLTLPARIVLPLAFDIRAAQITNARVRQGERSYLIEQLQVAARGDANGVRLRTLTLDSPHAKLEASGNIALTEPYILDAGIDWSASLPFGDSVRLAGETTLQGSLKRLRITNRLSAPATATLRAHVALFDGAPKFDLAGEWQDVAWPLTEPAQYRSPQGEFRAEGTMDNYRANLATSVVADGLPPLDVRVDGAGDNEAFTINEFAIDLLNGRLNAGGNIRWSPRIEWALEVNAADIDPGAQWPEWPGRFALNAVIEGDIDQTPHITARIESLTGSLREQALAAQGGVEFRDDQLTSAFTVSALGVDANIDASAQVNAELPFDAAVTWSAKLPENLGESLQAEGAGTVSGNRRHFRIDHQLSAPFDITSTGSVALGADAPRFDIEGDWKDLHWPLANGAQYRSETGHYQIQGVPQDYTASLSAALSGRQIPRARLELAGNGDPEIFKIQTLAVDTLGGRINVRGQAGWQPIPAWDLNITAAGIDPGRHWPDWPGSLEADVGVRGDLGDAGLRIDSDIRALHGTLREHTLAVTGALAFGGKRLQAEALRIESGPNRLQLDGTVDERLDLSFVLEAPALDALLPTLKGAAQGSGRLGGLPRDPAVQARLQASNLAWGEYRAAKLEADIALDPADARASRSTVTLLDAGSAGYALARLDIEMQGNAANHTLNSTLTDKYGKGALTASGAFREGVWNGSLSKLNLEPKRAGRWRLQRPVELSVAADRVELAPFCLRRNKAALCGNMRWQSATGLTTDGSLKALPLALANPFLPAALTLRGEINGQFSAAPGQGGLTASLDATVDSGALRYAPPNADPLEAGFSELRLAANIVPDKMQGELTMQVLEQGHIRANATVDGKAQGQTVQGGVEAALPDVAALAGFVPQLSELQGALALDMSVRGRLDAPRIAGALDLRDASVQIPEAGLTLSDINLTAESAGGNRLKVNGSASSGGGTLNVTGDALLVADKGWPLTLRLEGSDFQVVNLAEVRANASPALDIRATTDGVEIEGDLLIPYAAVEVKELPASAVSITPDEVIAGDDTQARASRAPPVHAEIDLRLGDDVSFKGFGLTTNLTGKLRIDQGSTKLAQARGNLILVDGRYTAYGQKLEIDPGQLIFAGPITDPYVDVRASRKSGEVTAGIYIQGRLRDPRSQIYSTPVMGEADALSYLLTGRPLSGASQGEGQVLTQAAISLGLNQSLPVIRQIGRTLGLDEVKFDSDGGVDESAVTVGKFLSPDLYVGYVYGLFDRVGGVLLRYQLNRNVSLEAQSGLTQSLDLIYSLERD